MKHLILMLFVANTFLGFAGVDDRQWAIDNYHRYYNEAAQCKDVAKEKAIADFRAYFQKNGHRTHSIKKVSLSTPEILKVLQKDGIFSDINLYDKTGDIDKEALGQAWLRLLKIAVDYHNDQLTFDQSFTDAFQKSILYYGEKEINRPQRHNRFHPSCFAMPTSAVNIYFFYLPLMDQIESGENTNPQLKEVCDMLKIIGFQAWSQPQRGDETDQNIVQVNRFRNHVWWVGGNGLAFRSTLPVACMYKSIPMIDVLSVVSNGGIGVTSQNTNKTAFWTEGMTADGAGWGHGMQSLVWGYPCSGTMNAVDLMKEFINTPWEVPMNEKNKYALFNYIQGSNWYFYKGYVLPGLSRGTFHYVGAKDRINTVSFANALLENWSQALTTAEKEELVAFKKEAAENNNIHMASFKPGIYNGTRYFFNNDDLIKKNDRYHIMVNMASIRCDGVESAINFADEYNFCTDDGGTLFQKEGNEYNQILGAWDPLAYPGATSRRGAEKLKPVTNWRGYCSKYNFAGGATSGGVNAVAGLNFEKLNASTKKGTNDKGTSIGENDILYGISAHKAFFMLGDYFVALGAGVTDLNPKRTEMVNTTIDQTAHLNDVFLKDGKGKKMSITAGTHSLVNKGAASWLIQKDKFAYTVLPEYTKDAYVSIDTRKMDWFKMNQSNKTVKNKPVSASILQVGINHGVQPKNDKYGYVVYAGDNYDKLTIPFTVLSNDTLIQAIESKDKNVLACVIYDQKQTVKGANISLQTDHPCIVLLERQNGNQYLLSVCDPTMDASITEMNLSINGKTHKVTMYKDELLGKPMVNTIQL